MEAFPSWVPQSGRLHTQTATDEKPQASLGTQGQCQCHGKATECLPEPQPSPPAPLRQVLWALKPLPNRLPSTSSHQPVSELKPHSSVWEESEMSPNFHPKMTLERKGLSFPSC